MPDATDTTSQTEPPDWTTLGEACRSFLAVEIIANESVLHEMADRIATALPATRDARIDAALAAVQELEDERGNEADGYAVTRGCARVRAALEHAPSDVALSNGPEPTERERWKHRREVVTDWVMAQLAAVDDEAIFARTNYGQITMTAPAGRVFTVTVEEVESA